MHSKLEAHDDGGARVQRTSVQVIALLGARAMMQKRGGMTYPRDEIRVLVIDDHAMFAEAVARAVDVEPDLVLVGTALNLEDADRALAMHDIDAAILDIDVAGESGVELLRTWSRKLPDASFVVLVTEVRRDVVRVLELEARVDAGPRHHMERAVGC